MLRSTDKHKTSAWIGLGLLIGAVVLRLVMMPWLTRIPSQFSRTVNLSGDVTLFDLIAAKHYPINATVKVEAIGSDGNNVKIHETVSFNSLFSSQSLLLKEAVDTLLNQAAIKNEYWSKLGLLLGTDTVDKTFWVDGLKATYISPAEANQDYWTLPPGQAHKSSYAIYDGISNSTTQLSFAGSEKVDRINTYAYKATFGTYGLGSVSIPQARQSVSLNADGELKLNVEELSSYPVSASLAINLYAQVGGLKVNVLRVDFATPASTIKAQAETAWWAAVGMVLGNWILPIGLLIAGLFLLMRSRRKTTIHPSRKRFHKA